MKRQVQGFSLIEVLISIAILGVVSLALLSFFSSANFYSSTGKSTQEADLAAQSVLEEVNSCKTLTDIDDRLMAATGSAWSIVKKESNQMTLSKKVTVDGADYQARVLFDYDYDTTDADGNQVASKYNNYEQPKLQEIYSANNAVVAESDQLSTAVSHFYYKNQDVSKSVIQNALTRNILIDISKDDEQEDIYQIDVSYRYSYGGDEFTTVVKNQKAEKDSLQNIYVLYNLLHPDALTDSVEVNLGDLSIEEAKQLKFYLICQKDGAVPATGYKILLSGSGNFLQPVYYTNGASLSAGSFETDFVTHEKQERIAGITVDVYQASETDFSEENRIVRLQSSKGA